MIRMALPNKVCRSKESGASMIEYALIAVLIAIVCLAGVQVLGTSTSGRFSSVASSVAATP